MYEELIDFFETIEVTEVEEVANVIFDAIENGHTAEEVQEIADKLLEIGVDVRPLCRKKHPT